MRDIVCVSTNYWDGEWFRKQQFAVRFARAGHRVLFVEPSYSVLRSVRGREYIRNLLFRPVLREDISGVWVLTPRRMIPLVSRPWSSRLNAVLLAAQIRWALVKLQMKDVLLWVYPAEFAPALESVPHAGLVFDIVDDLVAYELKPSRATYVRECLRQLVAEADVVVCTTEGLAAAFAPGAVVVPNGYDAALFDAGTPQAAALQGYDRIVGFVGTIFRYLDYGLIDRVATDLPDATIALVGRLADEDETLSALLGRPNVIHVPPVPRGEVPAYVAAFDVCIVPFKVNDVSRNVSPLKAYEYLAMNKPVVSVPMPSLSADPAAAGVVFANSHEEFVRAVELALDGAIDAGDPEAARSASWDGRFASVCRAVGELVRGR